MDAGQSFPTTATATATATVISGKVEGTPYLLSNRQTDRQTDSYDEEY